MRFTIAIILMMSVSFAKAQSFIPISFEDYSQQQFFLKNIMPAKAVFEKKWFLTSYTGISANYIFSKYGNASVVTVPFSLQLNKRLNNNFFAFGNVSVAPAFIHFQQDFLNTNIYKNGMPGYLHANNLGIYQSASLGVMYINDARTFSISGSISIEKSVYPSYSFPSYSPVNKPVFFSQ